MCQEIILSFHTVIVIDRNHSILSNGKPLTSISIFIPPSWKYPGKYEVIHRYLFGQRLRIFCLNTRAGMKRY
ncbi:unnamed protein product [Trifolium pratense]|uniref:Uncharacterized protein n=1 Tax=Trifolium pratense TaxID=57577 RepID=A0ACB0JZL7_TRIPR|nr:unnamed protein product [Trifolium pratense]